jgi:hypothetical protein
VEQDQGCESDLPRSEASRQVDAEVIRRWAQRSAAASARLAGRNLPTTYIRSEALDSYLRERSERCKVETSGTNDATG